MPSPAHWCLSMNWTELNAKFIMRLPLANLDSPQPDLRTCLLCVCVCVRVCVRVCVCVCVCVCCTGRTPLLVAVQNACGDYMETASLLLCANADPGLRDERGNTPLRVATANQNAALITQITLHSSGNAAPRPDSTSTSGHVNQIYE